MSSSPVSISTLRVERVLALPAEAFLTLPSSTGPFSTSVSLESTFVSFASAIFGLVNERGPHGVTERPGGSLVVLSRRCGVRARLGYGSSGGEGPTTRERIYIRAI